MKEKTESEKTLRVTGFLLGKFAPVLVSRSSVEIRTISTPLLAVTLWIGVVAFFFTVSLLLDPFWASILTILAGMGGFLLITRQYPGRLEQRMELAEIASFVRGDVEFIFNLRDNRMYTVNLSRKKQDRLLECLARQFKDHPDFRLVRMGEYLKVYPRQKEEQNSRS